MEFDATLCCGCGACANICPTGAITWTADDKGFAVPSIDQEKCVNCGLCRKVCPYEQNHVGVDADPQVYAALHRDPEVLRASSSGGVFTALSDWMLDQGGAVYGVAFDEQYRPVCRRAETKEERNALRGSKYVQCDGCAVYPRVEADLRAGRRVMFTGTPCQISGLKAALEQKKVPMEGLYTVDNICHGAASPAVWQSYLDYIRTQVLENGNIQSFSMRSKDAPWQSQKLKCVTAVGDESRALNRGASWNKLYQTTCAVRESCFHCRFPSYDRVGDITLADYWNVENAGVKLDWSRGINLVLVNSPKGEDWFNACREDLLWQESDKKSCWQLHLEGPAVPARGRSAFWAEYARDPSACVERYAHGSRVMDLARSVTPLLRKAGLYTLATRLLRRVKDHGRQ